MARLKEQFETFDAKDFERTVKVLDKEFFELAKTIKNRVSKRFNGAVNSSEKNVTIRFKHYYPLFSKREGQVREFVDFYARGENERVRGAFLKSEGFKKFHQVCKEEDFRIEFPVSEEFHVELNVYFGKGDHYKDSKDADIWGKMNTLSAKIDSSIKLKKS